MVKKANAKETEDQDAIAKPVHSMISPRKLPQDTYSNKPPENGIKFCTTINCCYKPILDWYVVSSIYYKMESNGLSQKWTVALGTNWLM